MSSIPCDIVLLPSEKLANLARATSKQLAPYGTYFTLKDGEYFAHMSLYMVQLDIDTLPHITSVLGDFANTTSPIHLTAKNFHQENRYMDIEYERNETIDGIQNTILELINPLRSGLRKKDEARIATSTGIELENLQKYGYRSVGSKFAPHITLTRFLDETPQPTIDTNPREFDGEFSAIGLFEMGDNGTCVRKIAEIPLSA